MDRHFNNSDELCKYVSNINDTCFCAFSGGKDSLAAYIQLKKHFKNIHLVYFYFVPNLSFIEQALTMYEDQFEQKIIRLMHPTTYSQLKNGMYQTPQSYISCKKIYDFSPTYEDLFDLLREELNLPNNR